MLSSSNAFSNQQSLVSEIATALQARFHVPVLLETDKDQVTTFTLNAGHVLGSCEGETNPHVLTPKNLSAAIEPWFHDVRRSGGIFTQPVSGSFAVRCPALN